MSNPTDKQLEKLEQIASKLGCSIADLLKDKKDPSVIIESFEKKELKILND